MMTPLRRRLTVIIAIIFIVATSAYAIIKRTVPFASPSAIAAPIIRQPHNHVRLDLFAAYAANEKKYATVMLGDSITEWVEWNELLGVDDIANRGIAGDTTDGFLRRLDAVYEVKPARCFLMGGINDLLRGGDVATTLKNLTQIVVELRRHDITPIVQSTLFVAAGFDGIDNVINQKVAQLNQGLRELCRRENLQFLDVNSVLSDANGLRYTVDGLHLSAAGYAEWGKLLRPLINEK